MKGTIIPVIIQSLLLVSFTITFAALIAALIAAIESSMFYRILECLNIRFVYM
jgi:hypothetical protein